MLDKSNCVEISEQTKALLYGDKRDVSRAYRRFLSRVIGAGVVIQRFTEETAALATPVLKNYKDYASKVLLVCNEYAQDGDFSLGTTVTSKPKDAVSVVENRYAVNLDLETASLAQLQRVARYVHILANAMKAFSLGPDAELYSVTKAAEKERKQSLRKMQAAGEKRFFAALMRSRTSV